MSVKNTQKITRAMYLMSASKSKKAKKQFDSTASYFHQITMTMSEIIAETEKFSTPFFDGLLKAAGKADLYLVLAGDKGMAGGYNRNIINLLEANASKDTAELWVAGFTGRSRIMSKGYRISPEFTYPVMDPSLFRAREIAEKLLEVYLNGDYRKVWIVYTDMITPLQLTPVIAQLLPLKPEDFTHRSPDVGAYEKVVYEPNAKAVFEHLAPQYLKGILYGAFVSAFTSEQHARMYAMDNATNSANDMITRLSLSYNRSRQTHITQEINEIVGGIPAE